MVDRLELGAVRERGFTIPVHTPRWNTGKEAPGKQGAVPSGREGFWEDLINHVHYRHKQNAL